MAKIKIAKFACIATSWLMMSCQPRIIKSEDSIIRGPIQNFYRDKSGERHDAVELDPRYKEIFSLIDDEVNQTLKNNKYRGSLGFIHIFWHTKEQILLRKYGIKWRSPADLNPSTCYD